MVAILLLSGTSYDYYLRRLEDEAKMSNLNGATYTNAIGMFGTSPIKLDMTMPDTKTKNGKLFINPVPYQ